MPASVDYDNPHDLLVVQTTRCRRQRTALQPMTTGFSLPRCSPTPTAIACAVAFDILGMVAGTAVMGKTTENLGDSLTNFTAI